MNGNGWDSDDEKYTWRDVGQTMSAPVELLEDPWGEENGQTKSNFERQEKTPKPTPNSTPLRSSPLKPLIPVVPSAVEDIKNQLLLESSAEASATNDDEKVFALDATADMQELAEKVLNLQKKLRGQMIKVFESQEAHDKQVQENKTLREYVQNLLNNASTQGTDRFGRPIAASRSSSLKKTSLYALL